MSAQVPAEPRKTPPPWLVPVGLGLIIVLLVALIVVVLTRDDNSNSVDGSLPVATTAPGGTAVETVPETSAAATGTTPLDTAPDATVPATEPATTVPVVISEGQASVVAEGSTQTFGVAATCSDFWAGAQTTSHLLLDSASHHVWVVDVVSFEEGGDRIMQAVDMDLAIAANVFGQDAGVSPTYSGTIDDNNQRPGLTSATLKLTSGDGAASIDVTIGDTTLDDCAVGAVSPQTPFASGTQVEWQPPDSTNGERFNVIADCGGNLIVSGGGLLLTDYPQDGNPMAAGLVNTHNLTGSDVWWTNLVSPTLEETAFDQGTGDINAALNVYPDGDRTAPEGYLSWTQRPSRTAVGDSGLLGDVCTQRP